MDWQPLIPELVVSDLDASLKFYVSTLGFEVKYRWDTSAFAHLEREDSQIMLEQRQHDSWVVNELSPPFGRGLNLQIQCADVTALRTRVAAADIDVYLELGDVWYEAGDASVELRQFIVADPDGYLLRFCQVLGERRRDD